MRNEKRATALVPLLRFDTEDFADALRDAVLDRECSGQFPKVSAGAGLTATHMMSIGRKPLAITAAVEGQLNGKDARVRHGASLVAADRHVTLVRHYQRRASA